MKYAEIVLTREALSFSDTLFPQNDSISNLTIQLHNKFMEKQKAINTAHKLQLKTVSRKNIGVVNNTPYLKPRRLNKTFKYTQLSQALKPPLKKSGKNSKEKRYLFQKNSTILFKTQNHFSSSVLFPWLFCIIIKN